MKLLSEDSVSNLDLPKLKESLISLTNSEGLAKKLVAFLDKLTFDKEFCGSCRQNQVVLDQELGLQQPPVREKLGKQVFSLLFYKLRDEQLLITKIEKGIFDIGLAKNKLERFKELQLQQEAMLSYNRLVEEKMYWEEKKRAVETLEIAAYW